MWGIKIKNTGIAKKGQDKKTKKVEESSFSFIMQIKSIPTHFFKLNGESYEFCNGFYFKEITFKEIGSSFGELALLSKGVTRQATIRTTEPCAFITLDRTSFQRCLARIEHDRMNMVVEFL